MSADLIDIAALAEERSSVTRALMRDRGLDHLLLGTPDNIRYVSDARTLLINESADWVLALFDGDGQTDIFAPWVKEKVDTPYPQLAGVRSLRPVPGWVPIMAEPEYLIRALSEALRAAGARSVGYDAVHPELIPELSRALPGVEFRFVGNDLFRARGVKSAAEIALMEHAHLGNLAALEKAWSVAAPGARDFDLLAASLSQMQHDGAELITHFTCSVRPDFGVWHPVGKEIHEGDAVFIDQVYYGPGGYASDLTRTVFVGEPPAEVLAAYGRLIEARRVVEQAARPGVAVWELDELMNRELERMGLGPSPYALGHGIGLRVCEPPALTEQGMVGRDVRLEAGQTVALEPETVFLHRGTPVVLKIEDCFVVEDAGLRGLGPLASADDCVIA
ncbi:MAG: M24 family metallopeptidase [Microbacterium sp.]